MTIPKSYEDFSEKLKNKNSESLSLNRTISQKLGEFKLKVDNIIKTMKT